MSGSPDSPTFALPPFDHAKADVILRSSDGIEFRVFRLFLALASPFFETLFGLPQPSEENNTDTEIRNGLPVVPVSEDSKTLDSLLRFCYPCTLAEDPVLEDFREIINVLEATKKYSFDAIQQAVCKSLFSPEILKVNALRCFAIARHARLRHECILAAKYTLREPLVPLWFKEIELITSAELLSLLTYRQQCSNAVQTLKGNLPQFLNGLGPGPCNCCQSQSGSRKTSESSEWWKGFVRSTFLDLSEKPCAETIQTNINKAIQAIPLRSCTHCHDIVANHSREFAIVFTNKVEEVISKIVLNLTF
ncbi:hypothetical protein EDC04DRAFT_1138829 [Pisolithus marmoratus]|nr:hypothetical protein EDC04DRAFT_1138829 [Pisolithus marmoratus]